MTGTPKKSQARPLKAALAGVSSAKRRRRKPRYGAMPVPVPTMIRSAVGSCSGMSITLPIGPVTETASPGWLSHRKLEHTPFLAGSSRPSSLSQYTARRTQSDTEVAAPSSP